MSRYETEEDQIEAIKSWWKKHGTTLLTGVLVVVLAFSGWRYWSNSQYVASANASATFEALQTRADQGAFGEVAREALKLMQEQPDSAYAVAAAFMYAKYELDQGKVDVALEKLTWVVDNAQDPELKALAKLRKARIYLDQKNVSAADLLLAELKKSPLSQAEQANVAYVAGLSALQQSQSESAREAFTAVLDNPKADENLRGLAQIQLDDLAQ
ncbi:MAG: tetratricopeptide repeat protein [Thiotrichales bacterium]|nr:tetratricopeptide repeat protein [Thiotrichales bacterium]